jgi:hypothetical protein
MTLKREEREGYTWVVARASIGSCNCLLYYEALKGINKENFFLKNISQWESDEAVNKLLRCNYGSKSSIPHLYINDLRFIRNASKM